MQSAILILAIFTCASAIGTERFLSAPNSKDAKEDSFQMLAVAKDEMKEAKAEQKESEDEYNDSRAIKEVAADAEKAEETQARKELKGTDLDAALAVAHDEEARSDLDAKQLAVVSDGEQKDADATKKEAAQVQSDATRIEVIAQKSHTAADAVHQESATEKKADAKQMKLVAEIEEGEAEKEQVEARDELNDGIAIEAAAALRLKDDKAKAMKELTSKNDQDAAVAVAQDEEVREFKDAAQMEDVAAKEVRDADATVKDVARMRKDAAALEGK